MMIVSIKGHNYTMKRGVYKKYIKRIGSMIKKQPTIIALENGEYAEMRNDAYENQKELNKAIKKRKERGYTARYIRGAR